MKAWCLELDGRRDRDECAKPIVGRGTGPAVDPVAVFSLVRFQEKEMRKAMQGKKYDEKSGDRTTACNKWDRAIKARKMQVTLASRAG